MLLDLRFKAVFNFPCAKICVFDNDNQNSNNSSFCYLFLVRILKN